MIILWTAVLTSPPSGHIPCMTRRWPSNCHRKYCWSVSHFSRENGQNRLTRSQQFLTIVINPSILLIKLEPGHSWQHLEVPQPLVYCMVQGSWVIQVSLDVRGHIPAGLERAEPGRHTPASRPAGSVWYPSSWLSDPLVRIPVVLFIRSSQTRSESRLTKYPGTLWPNQVDAQNHPSRISHESARKMSWFTNTVQDLEREPDWAQF